MMTEQFLDTLERCYKDLYWCWKNTGLSGSLSLELANTWADRTGPLQAHFEETIKAWNDTMTGLEGKASSCAVSCRRVTPATQH
jgi:hypothetical protein